MTDHTHDVNAASWVASANGHPQFPIQNLPLGVFSPQGGDARIGAAIGDTIVDLRALARSGHLSPDLASVLEDTTLNRLFGLGPVAMRALRHRLFALLLDGAPEAAAVAETLHDQSGATMTMPTRPGGYTDFYAGIVHATNVGSILRPTNPLMPNYKHIPIGYHGRTSSIRSSGTAVRRPVGQLKGPDDVAPHFARSERIDYEVELGFWVGQGNELGTPIAIRDAGDHLAGVSLLNDWSARDIQAWEYQPLGPFLAKNFATTVSPWVVTLDALEPFRVALMGREQDDPVPLPYLVDATDQAQGAFNIDIDVSVSSHAMRDAGQPAALLGQTNAAHLYWTPAQLVAHHSSNGCPLEPGDLIGTGTISAPQQDGFGSLMEITRGGKQPFTLGGADRRFLEDGDEVVMTGRCTRPGFATIGFGECRAVVLPAVNVEGSV